MTDKYAFLKMQAPPSYVAGLGRGAAGFTTRSDIGPAREVTSTEAGVGKETTEGQEGEDGQYQDPENESGLFAGMVYDKDDEEADMVYELVQQRMDQRSKIRREKREKEEAEEYLKNNPRIQDRFSDLKRGLSAITDDQWENLPEVGNLTGKRRKATQKDEYKSYVVPDSVLVSGRDNNSVQASLDEQQMTGGYETPADGGMTDFRAIGEAQGKVLSLSLDRATNDSATGQTTIDPKGYLTDLDSVIHKTEAEIGDTKRGRTLLQSLTKSNRKHAPGWIAAARLEEVAGKMLAARKIIQEGCENCPKSEEVWREAARLNTPENAKIVLANAITHIPTSVNIWLDAADLEQDINAKKRVLRKALEYIPNSVKLWRKTVNLEDNPADARVLLARAVEVIPLSVELWLALARVETPDKATSVLNKARKTIPTSHEIWIAAARLLEQEGKDDQVEAIMANGVAALKRKGVELPRDDWLREAERCEQLGSVATAQGIVKATIGRNVLEEDRLDTWVDDAQSALSRGKIQVARAIYAYALKVYPDRQSLWRRAADLEKGHGTRESLLEVLNQAVNNVPKAEILWLMAAKEAWLGGDVPTSRSILAEAFKANPESEQIWLAASKLEAENGELDAARKLLTKARQIAQTDRIWIKSAVFERLHGDTATALATVNEGIQLYPTADKFYMMKGQILESQNEIAKAREAYSTGCKKCPDSIPLWILSSRLEEKAGMAIKSRALIERGRQLNPRNEELWLESVKVEERLGNASQAKVNMARALQECPSSGLLWAAAVWMEGRVARKTKSVDALKKANNDPRVIVVVARMFWSERNLAKARTWFEKAVTVDKDLGDSWGWWYKFEKQHGTKEQQEAVATRCAVAEPHHGPVWQATLKDVANASKDTKEILQLVSELLVQ